MIISFKQHAAFSQHSALESVNHVVIFISCLKVLCPTLLLNVKQMLCLISNNVERRIIYRVATELIFLFIIISAFSQISHSVTLHVIPLGWQVNCLWFIHAPMLNHHYSRLIYFCFIYAWNSDFCSQNLYLFPIHGFPWGDASEPPFRIFMSCTIHISSEFHDFVLASKGQEGTYVHVRNVWVLKGMSESIHRESLWQYNIVYNNIQSSLLLPVNIYVFEDKMSCNWDILILEYQKQRTRVCGFMVWLLGG